MKREGEISGDGGGKSKVTNSMKERRENEKQPTQLTPSQPASRPFTDSLLTSSPFILFLCLSADSAIKICIFSFRKDCSWRTGKMMDGGSGRERESERRL